MTSTSGQKPIVRHGKDTLAVGNVTGAMTFQATIPVAFGLAVTKWDLEPEAIVAGAIAVAGRAVALHVLPRRSVGILPRSPGGRCSWASSPSGKREDRPR